MGKIYQIRVVGIKGETKTIDVAHSEEEFNSTTVDAFREKVTEKFPELKGQNFKMFYTKDKLEDGTLSENNINDKSTIMLIVTLPGGCAL